MQIKGYVLKQEIGSGASSVVYEGVETTTQRRVAVKMISKDYLRNETLMKMYRREVDILKLIDHPFIVALYEELEDEKAFYLVMELVEGSNLVSLVNSWGRLSESMARKYFVQIIDALDYLHNEAKVIHRDLKLENIIIDANDNIRIIDFGISKFIEGNDDVNHHTCGSEPYLPPEMILNNGYSVKADIWSIGVTLYTLVYGSMPFSPVKNKNVFKSILYETPKFLQNVSQELRDLLTNILQKDPLLRISIDMIKQHSWCNSPNQDIRNMIPYKISKLNRFDDNTWKQFEQYIQNPEEIIEDIKRNHWTHDIAIYRILKTELIKKEVDQALHRPERSGSYILNSGRKIVPEMVIRRNTNHPNFRKFPRINIIGGVKPL